MQPQEKACIKCGVVKPLSSYYKHPQMSDGHLGKCSECCKVDAVTNRRNKADRYKEYDTARAKNPDRIRLRSEGTKRRRKQHPEKHRAYWKVKRALAAGNLTKAPCEVCGSDDVVGHHDDYSKPMEVRWLCHTHHMEHHRKYD